MHYQTQEVPKAVKYDIHLKIKIPKREMSAKRIRRAIQITTSAIITWTATAEWSYLKDTHFLLQDLLNKSVSHGFTSTIRKLQPFLMLQCLQEHKRRCFNVSDAQPTLHWCARLNQAGELSWKKLRSRPRSRGHQGGVKWKRLAGGPRGAKPTIQNWLWTFLEGVRPLLARNLILSGQWTIAHGSGLVY